MIPASAEPSTPLLRSRVLVVGLEPWGAVAAAELAAAGAGALHLLDDQPVTGDDIFAAFHFAEEDRGKGRAAALVERLSPLAPACVLTSGPLVAAANRPLELGDTRWDLVLTCVSADELLVQESVARFAQAAGLVSVCAYLDGLEGVIGPVVVPGKTACWGCARVRRLAHSPQPGVDRALHAALLVERAPRRARMALSPAQASLGHALALTALELLASPGEAALAGRISVQSTISLEETLHLVLPAPGCAVCGGSAGAAPGGAESRAPLCAARDEAELRGMLQGVVDPRTGIVGEILMATSESALALDTPRTAVAFLGRYSAHACDEHEPQAGSGKGLTTVEAMIGAVGEAVERYAAAYVDPRRLSRAAASQLSADFLAPDRLCLYDEGQYGASHFPFRRITPETPIDWTPGTWLDTRAPVLLPALPTYFAYTVPPDEHFCQVTSNGLAAGPTLDEAAMRAALELVERDAFMLTWLARLPGRRIEVDDSVDPGAREVLRQLADRGLRVALHLLDAGAGIPAVMCVAYGDGDRWPGAMVSLAAHLSPRAAIRKAILEQGQNAPYIRRLMMEGRRPIPERPEDVHTLEDHALYYVPPSRASAFSFLAWGDAVPAAALEEPEAISLDLLVRRLGEGGLRVAIADLTSPDLASTPFRVARALGPDFQQIHFGHRLARLGNPRLRAITPLGVNPDPHPLD